MLAYDSQFEKQRPYFTKEFIEGLARIRGVQVNEAFAEALKSKTQIVDALLLKLECRILWPINSLFFWMNYYML